jgi:hypothetical protein
MIRRIAGKMPARRGASKESFSRWLSASVETGESKFPERPLRSVQKGKCKFSKPTTSIECARPQGARARVCSGSNSSDVLNDSARFVRVSKPPAALGYSKEAWRKWWMTVPAVSEVLALHLRQRRTSAGQIYVTLPSDAHGEA